MEASMTGKAPNTSIAEVGQQSVLIGLFNINERSRTAIEMVLKRSGLKGNHIVAEHRAQIFIVDVDGGNTDKIWQGFRQQFPDQPAIILSVSESHIPDTLWVKKPVKPIMLVEAIRQITQQLNVIKDNKQDAEITPKVDLSSNPSFKVSSSVLSNTKQVAEINSNAELATELTSSVATAIQTNNRQANEIKPKVDLAIKQTPAKTSSTMILPLNPAQNDIPATVANILNLANTIDSEPTDNLCGSRSDISSKDTKNLALWFYDPQLYLQGVLSETLNLALVDGRSREIECGGYVILVVPGIPSWVVTTLTTRRLRSVCSIQLGKLYHAKVNDLISNTVPLELQKLSFEKFQWFVTLVSASGRLPIGTNIHAPVKLQHWPNFTKLLITPHAMQIAALWMVQPMSLLETAAHLEIPQRYVFSFYSAVNSIGIASIDSSISNTNTEFVKEQQPQRSNESSEKINDRRGFLARMLAKLK